MGAGVTVGLLLDGTLALALPIVAWRALASRDLFESVLVFVAFGLLSALSWARLAAPDIALVEAAVGAGVTGALLIETLARLREEERLPEEPAGRGPHRLVLGSGLLLGAAGLGVVLQQLPEHDPGLRPAVLANLDKTGVSQPVSAVLLDLRAHDTLLEVAVLLAAGVAARSLPTAALPHRPDRAGPLLGVLARLLVPSVIVVAGYLVWAGSHRPGGAFQAGATLAAAGILLIIAGRLQVPETLGVRLLLVAGPAVFLGIGVAGLVFGEAFLAYGAWSKVAILLIEWTLAPSLALVLLMFFPARIGAAEDDA